jgi:hypothetical protein
MRLARESPLCLGAEHQVRRGCKRTTPDFGVSTNRLHRLPLPRLTPIITRRRITVAVRAAPASRAPESRAPMTEPPTEYLIGCPTCTGEFDAATAIWCSCDPQNPTKLCPFCLSCFCEAQEAFREEFWRSAPPELLDERTALKEARLLLGDMLVRAGVISMDQLLQGLKRQKAQGMRLGDALISLGFLTKERMEEFLRVQQSVVSFDLTRVILDLSLIRQIGVEFCRRQRILPLEKDSFKNRTLLTLAMANPADADTINRVQRMSGCQVVAGRGAEEKILEVLHTHFPDEVAAPVPAPELALEADDAISTTASPEAPTVPSAGPPASAPVVDDETTRLANKLLRTGVERGAEEIRLFRQGDSLEVRYRIGGRVYRAGAPPGANAAAVLDCVRRLAEIDAGGEGRLRIPFAGGEVVLQVLAGADLAEGRIILRPD